MTSLALVLLSPAARARELLAPACPALYTARLLELEQPAHAQQLLGLPQWSLLLPQVAPVLALVLLRLRAQQIRMMVSWQPRQKELQV